MQSLIRSYGDTDFITGLRAIAAFMVIAIHTGAFRDFGLLGNVITDNGKYGVQVFFVISGFTIAQTYRTASGFWPYFGRRFMRIAPLYYFLVLVGFALILTQSIPTPYWMDYYGSQPDLYNLLMHLSFLSPLDARVTASILGVEWTIPIEMFWYLVLPLFLPIALIRRRVVMVLAGLLVLAAATRAIGHFTLPPSGAHFLPFTYGAYFFLGALCDALRREWVAGAIADRMRWLYASYGLFALALTTDIGVNSALFGIATAGIIVFHPGSNLRKGVLGARPILFLGSISYSLYLIHYLIISLAQTVPDWFPSSGLGYFAVIAALTTAASTLTYLLIERPSNLLGRRMFERLRTADA